MMEYEAEIICGNCGGKNTVSVELGKSVKSHLRLKSEECSNCKRRISHNTYSVEHKSL